MEDYHQLIADTVVAESNRHGGRLIDYIEVGVLTGNSASAVLSTGKCRHAILIDNFSNTHCGDVKSSRYLVERNLSHYAELLEILEGDSSAILPTLSEKYDIGFIDGDHSAVGCQSDLEKMFPLIRDDGVLFVDDMRNPGCLHIEGLVKHFAKANNLTLKFHAVHHGLGELRKN